MTILAKLIGAAVTVFGLAIFASPQFTQKVFVFFKQGKRIYLAGVIRISVGVVLLLAASRSSVPLAAIALGALFLLSGVIVFAADPEKLKSFMEHYSAMPGLVIRLLGLVAACFGVLVFSIF
jgi:uncharacterized protein YjeT (DUF2065 family)